jgi:hypothetical protein
MAEGSAMAAPSNAAQTLTPVCVMNVKSMSLWLRCGCALFTSQPVACARHLPPSARLRLGRL